MSDSRHDKDRRRFLTGTTAAGVATAFSADATALQNTWSAAAHASVVVHDPRFTLSSTVLQRLGANGARAIALTDDPVRLWRSEAGVPLRDPSTTLLGITGWSDLLLFRGMAAETRRHLRHENFDSSVGAFLWLIE